MPTVQDVILHCQKQIKKEPPEEKLMHYLSRLDRLRVTLQDLMDTGVGRTINQISRHDGDVGHEARKLVRKWKAMVSENENENSDDESEDSQSSSSSGEDEEDDECDESDGLSQEDANPVNIIVDRKPPVIEPVNGYRKNSNNQQQELHSPNSSYDQDRLYKKKGDSSEQLDRYKELQEREKLRNKEKEDRRRERIKCEKLDSDYGEGRESALVSLELAAPVNAIIDKKPLLLEPANGYKKPSNDKPQESHSSNGCDDHGRSSKKKDKDGKKDHHQDRHRHKDRNEKSKRRSKEKEERREDRKKHDKEDSRNERKRKSGESKDKSIEVKRFPSPEHKKLKLENDIKRHKDKSSSSSKSKKPDIQIEEEIDSTRGVKFEELLGCLDTLNKSSKKRKEKNREKSAQQNVIPSTSSSKTVKEEFTKLERRKDLEKLYDEKKKNKHLESIIAPTLNISPNYKPSAATALLRHMVVAPPQKQLQGGSLGSLNVCDPGNYWEDNQVSLTNGTHHSNAEDDLASMMSKRIQRTKVFSGNKVLMKGGIPRLFDMCMQVIQENIQDLGYTGGVPYDILKPALERATAQQLYQIEECNPYLIGETDELWKFHCNREFRGRDLQELESWRELYERCINERDEKFAIVRRKMLKKGEVAEPVRKAKLAYVEPVGGPRFNRSKAATIKNGMRSLKIKEEKGPKKGVGTSASVGFNNPTESSRIVEEQGILINPDSRTAHASAPSSSRGERAESTVKYKARRAPLMAKTMKFIKTLQRR